MAKGGALPLFVLLVMHGATMATATLGNFTFSPPELLRVIEQTSHQVLWNCSIEGVQRVLLTASDEVVASVDNGTWWVTNDTDGITVMEGNFSVSAHFLGYSTVNLTLLGEDGEVLAYGELKTSVMLLSNNLSTIFATSQGVIIAIVYVFMGATIDLEVVKGIVKKPIGPAVGIVCQYGGMPLIAFGLSQVVFKDDPLLQLGIFLSGCCPGGGASNMWTHLLGGRLDLSIMMTFASTIFAFVAIPAWVFALGPVIAGQTDFMIPFGDIAIMVVSLVLPCGAGVLIQKFLPKVAKIMKKLLTPFSLLNIIYIFTFGVYANFFVFSIIDFRMIASGLALPILGFLLGIISSIILRLPRQDMIAISIETGIQNASIAQFILFFTLEQPAGSIAFVMAAAYVLMTPIPLALAFIIKTVYTKVRACIKPEEVKQDKDEEKSDAPRVEAPPICKDIPGYVSSVDLPMKKPSQGIDNLAAELDE